MKTPSKNYGGAVSQKATMRPLLSVQETKMKIAETGTKKPKGPHSTFPHSKRSEERSKHYHDKVLTSAEKLNPSKVLPAKREYPGL